MRKVVFLLTLLILSGNAFSQTEEMDAIKKLSKQRLRVYIDKIIDNKNLIGSVNLALAIQDVFDSNSFTEKNIPDLTYKSGGYWRAAMEQTPRDSSVLYANAYLCSLYGQVAYSDVYFLLGSINVNDDIIKELNSFKELRDKLYIKSSEEISDAIKAHDDGEYEKAIEIYDKEIEKCPELALFYYEKGLSCLMLGKGNPDSEWTKKGFELFQTCREKDPFFWRAYHDNDPNIITKQEILQEKVLPFYTGEIKRDPNSYMAFAEGCEQMELYPFAAHAQLKLSLIDPKNSEEHLDKFFELIEKAGCNQANALREMFEISRLADKERQQSSGTED